MNRKARKANERKQRKKEMAKPSNPTTWSIYVPPSMYYELSKKVAA